MVLLDHGGRDPGEAELIAPPHDLAHLVEHLWVGSHQNKAAAAWRVVPDASPHIIAFVTGQGNPHALRVHLVGARSCAASIDLSNRLLTVGVRLRPGALPMMTETSAREFVDRSIPVGDVFGAHVLQGLEWSGDAPANLILHELLGLLRRVARPRRAAALWPEFAPGLTVAQWAHWLESPTRSLRERIHREIGLSPKRTLRIARLHTALRAAQRSCSSWSDAAYTAGYADQAHLTREMGSLLGEAPTAWERRGSAVLFKTPRWHD